MNTRARALQLIFLLVLTAALSKLSSASEEHFLSYSGTAVARHSTRFLYGEQHELLYRDDRLAERVVLYTCRDGSPFARKVVSYTQPLAPDFLFEDASNGMMQGVRTEGDGRTVFFREGRVEPEKAGPLPQVRDLVADTGFDEFIRANWQVLTSGKPLGLHFLVPSRLDNMSFEAQRVRLDQLDGTPVDIIRLKPAGALGWVVPGIDVAYDASNKVLMRYEGVSDLRDASGNNYQTEITFRLSDRKPGSEQRNLDARRARLAACT